jgi:hypothetical protein
MVLAMRDYLTVEKIGYENGVYFTMEVYKLPDNFYRCYGYAMASGCKIADWQYIAENIDDAYSELTKNYLLRELRPMAKTQLTHIENIAKGWAA